MKTRTLVSLALGSGRWPAHPLTCLALAAGVTAAGAQQTQPQQAYTPSSMGSATGAATGAAMGAAMGRPWAVPVASAAANTTAHVSTGFNANLAPNRGAASTLRDLLARSVPWDPAVRLAAAAQSVAQERLSQSKSRFWPTLGLSVNSGGSTDSEFGREFKRTINRSEMLLRWNLYNGGADAAEATASEREWAATTEDLAQSLDLASERIAGAYLDAWRWQSIVEPSLARLKTIERWVEQARAQLRAGRLSDADLQQAEYSLVDAQLSHQLAVSELTSALGTLSALAGEPISAVVQQTLPQLTAEDARNFTPAGVRVAKLRAEAASSRVVSAANLAAPRVDVDARVRLDDRTTPQLTTSQRDAWSVGLRWEVPLGGETFSRRREAIARADGAQAEVARVEQGLQSELASIAPRVASTEQALAQLQSQAEQYNALLRAGRVQFDAGRRTLQQLIQLEDGRINVIQRIAEQSNKLDRLRLRLLVLSGRLSSTMGIDPAPPGAQRAGPQSGLVAAPAAKR